MHPCIPHPGARGGILASSPDRAGGAPGRLVGVWRSSSQGSCLATAEAAPVSEVANMCDIYFEIMYTDWTKAWISWATLTLLKRISK